MMKRRVVSILFAAVLLLSGCGSTAIDAGGSSVDGTATPSPTAAVTPIPSAATPTPQVAQGTATPGTVKLTLGKSQYAPNETVAITIFNGLTTAIFAADHQSACTMVELQLQDSAGQWQNQASCRQGILTRIITIPTGSAMPQYLSPGAAVFVKDATWPTGTYRIVFSYSNQAPNVPSPHVVSTSYSSVYSAIFSIA